MNILLEKPCKVCGVVKPQDRTHFHFNGRRSRGRFTYKPVCIECMNLERVKSVPIPPAYLALMDEAALVPLRKASGVSGYALVSKEDWELVIGLIWGDHSLGYPLSQYPNREKVKMHQVILGKAPEGMYIDHINGDTRDNRRCNLRVVTPSQNNANRGPQSGRKYKGITLTPQGNYIAQIAWQRQWYFIGRYPTPEEAARAYDRKARELHGEYAYQNFPEEVRDRVD